MVRLALERAVIRPQIDTVGNTSDSSLVNLQSALLAVEREVPHHFSGLCSGN